MENQAIFSSKDKSKKLKCRLLQFLYGALRVNPAEIIALHTNAVLFVISLGRALGVVFYID